MDLENFLGPSKTNTNWEEKMTRLEKGQYTVRIYEESVARKIDETYEKMISLFTSKNSFISRCVELGVEN